MFKDKFVLFALVLAIGLFAIIYLASEKGYGYTGDDGYNSHGSFWYFSGVKHHGGISNRSIREGSSSGPSGRGGGFSGGK